MLVSKEVYLKTADCQTREYGAGHVVNEVYIKSLKKWVMLDGQANVIPFLGKRPLSISELQEAIYKNKKNLSICSFDDVTFEQYIPFIKGYLYYFSMNIDFYDPYFAGKQLMLVPLNAIKPTVFQKTQVLKDLVYTYSSKDFYPEL